MVMTHIQCRRCSTLLEQACVGPNTYKNIGSSLVFRRNLEDGETEQERFWLCPTCLHSMARWLNLKLPQCIMCGKDAHPLCNECHAEQVRIWDEEGRR